MKDNANASGELLSVCSSKQHLRHDSIYWLLHFGPALFRAVVPKLWVSTYQWVMTQFLVGHEIDKLRREVHSHKSKTLVGIWKCCSLNPSSEFCKRPCDVFPTSVWGEKHCFLLLCQPWDWDWGPVSTLDAPLCRHCQCSGPQEQIHSTFNSRSLTSLFCEFTAMVVTAVQKTAASRGRLMSPKS